MEDLPERRFLIVTGEASGDAHAARLVAALRALGPCRVRGVTGPALEAAGAERVLPMDELAVIGFSAVLPRLPRILRARQLLLRELAAFRPHACVLVDSPGFNLRLGPALKRRGASIFYYIAPQVWAWHPKRAATMARWVDELAVVFPFEEALFRQAGVKTTFVGHPLLETLSPEVNEVTLRRELGLGAGQPVLGLLPGSRPQEVRHHLADMLAAARMLTERRPDLAVVVALASGPGAPGSAEALEPLLPRGWRGRTRAFSSLRAVRGRTRAVQAVATACAVASGTAALETALIGTPLVVVYRVGALNYAIARRLVTLDRIGLPNIVAGVDVAPELIQDAFTPARLAAALAPWLDDPSARAAQRAKLDIVRAKLGERGASARAATLLAALARS